MLCLKTLLPFASVKAICLVTDTKSIFKLILYELTEAGENKFLFERRMRWKEINSFNIF